MVSVQFPKNFTGPPFCGGWNKKLKTFFTDFSLERALQNICIVELAAVFVRLLLS